MKLRVLTVAVIFMVSLAGGFTMAHMGEKHGEKHEMMKDGGHEKMEVLHSTMKELNEKVEILFHSIIYGNYSGLTKPSGEIHSLAKNLEGTRPHENLEELETFNKFVEELQRETKELKRAVSDKKEVNIAERFGRVISVCVKCHARFRD